MADYDFDLFTIGAGSGGVAASRRAASYGARVAIAENVRVGGTCVLRGCVPKKLLVYGAHFAEEMADAAGFGWAVTGSLDWGKLIDAKNRELDRLNGIYIKMLNGSGVKIIDGHAELRDAHTVVVDGKAYTAKYILIATGGRPERPPIPGIEHTITSDEALELKTLPERVVVVGGGYIAVEFAGIFNAAGAQVRQIIRAPQILRGFDEDIRTHLAGEMTKKGIVIASGLNVTRIERADGAFKVHTDGDIAFPADVVMYATGRVPNTGRLGLDRVGVHLNKRGAIAVDEWQQTTVPGIYAIGDCTDRINLTPVAIAEGRALAETLFNRNPMKMDHVDVPSAVFSQPPVGTVGLSEASARLLGEVDVYKAVFRPMKHTLSGRDEKVLMKLVVERASDRVLGAHMVGPDAPEIIQGLAIAVKARLTKKDFDRTVAIHPTSAEEFVLMREPVKPAAAKAAE
ncbi:MAG TPA: glutathione-disulfide reductase [Alphaproteobacteria bacterium]|nr:glutathione-disulfide reductase [Alphaproteobacteria bacterium]